jgi:2-polyprenyl-3-methyl-5-hydroxy-6-metoxy-1,4-benzoquinol methylase
VLSIGADLDDLAAEPADQIDPIARRWVAGVAMRSRVLEIGCGTGALARLLARRGAHVTAIDVAPLIDLARSRTPSHLGIDYRVGELSRLSPRGFDVAIAVNALHALPLADAFARIAAAIRPGGHIVVVDRAGPWWSSLSEIRRVAGGVLPGAAIQRHLGWRYSARWTRPV